MPRMVFTCFYLAITVLLYSNMHIAILTGGFSSEREIILKSAQNMEKWGLLAGYKVNVSKKTLELYDPPVLENG